MNINHTDITIILDRSGSMAGTVNDTIGGFNRFLEDQKKVPGTATLTLHQFDHEHETPIKAQDIQRIAPLTVATYVPRGNTALLDAMGLAITETGRRLDSIHERDRAGKVVVVVITDGEENCSREFTQAKVFDLIKHQQEKYSWQFVFLGADQDAIKAGVGFGFTISNSANYAKTRGGIATTYNCAGMNLADFRTGAKATMAFNDSQKAAMMEEKK